MPNYLDDLIKNFKKGIVSGILNWDETQEHDETYPTVYSERRKQMEKRRKEQSNEPIYDFTEEEE